jgi:hypothetical protein
MLRLEYELGELVWSVLDCRQTMKPTYTRHARQQMTTRKINEAEVEDVLEHYHTSYADRQGNPILIGHPGGRRIKWLFGIPILRV